MFYYILKKTCMCSYIIIYNYYQWPGGGDGPLPNGGQPLDG